MNSASNENAVLYFIQPTVLNRLESGQFVARRQKSKKYEMRDRRNMLSLLNVTRRAIRYEPLVFSNRKSLILKAAYDLNTPEVKLLLVSGEAGRGKTAFVRGVAELMGGAEEQLLWFDVSTHTDFDEVVRFLIDSLTFLCKAQLEQTGLSEESNPITQLEQLLQQNQHHPILLVIDNVQHLVAGDQTIRSRELKEAFNFLLGFANLKLILAGRTLPFSDMNPSTTAVSHIALPVLTLEEGVEVVEAFGIQTPGWEAFLPSFHGEPWLIGLFSRLLRQSSTILQYQQALSHQTATTFLFEQAVSHLSDMEQRVLGFLALVRHPASPAALQALLSACELPGAFHFSQLDSSGVRFVLKRAYPPQLVLNTLLTQSNDAQAPQIEPVYQLIDAFVPLAEQLLSDSERQKIHAHLQAFYIAEKNKPLGKRLIPIRSRHLLAEAQYHSRFAKPAPDSPELKAAYRPGTASRPLTDLATQDIPLDWPQYDVPVPTAPEAISPAEYLPTKPVEAQPIVVQPVIATAPAQTIQLSQDDLVHLAELIQRPVPQLQAPMPTPNAGKASHLIVNQSSSPSKTQPNLSEAPIQSRLKAAMATHNRQQLAQDLLVLGQLRLEKGEYTNGRDCLLEALDLAQQTEGTHPAFFIHVFATLGHYERLYFHHNDALSHLHSALYTFESLALEDKTLEMLTQVAQAYIDQGDIFHYRHLNQDAISRYEQGIALLPDNSVFQAQALFSIALVYDTAGEVEPAAQAYQKALALCRVLQDDTACISILFNLANLHYDHGDYQEALTVMEDILALPSIHNTPKDYWDTLMLQSQIYEAMEKPHDAILAAQNAYQAVGKTQSVMDTVETLMRLAQLTTKTHDFSAALTYYQQVETLGETVLSPESLDWIREQRLILEEENQ